MCVFNRIQLDATPGACQTPLSVIFSRQEYWSGLPFPSPPGDLPNPETQLAVSFISCLDRWILYHCTTWEYEGILIQIKNTKILQIFRLNFYFCKLYWVLGKCWHFKVNRNLMNILKHDWEQFPEKFYFIFHLFLLVGG